MTTAHPADADQHQYQTFSGCLTMAVLGILTLAMVLGVMLLAGRIG